jgi:hypothetical protein
MLARITTLLLLIGSVEWFALEPGLESGLMAAGFSVTLVSIEVQRSKREPHPHDVSPRYRALVEAGRGRSRVASHAVADP